MPAAALVSDSEASRVEVGRAFPSAPYSVRRADLDDRSPLLVLSTLGESPAQWLHTGEALSQVLLEMHRPRPGHLPLTHITELGTSRSVIADLLTHPDVPQVAIRIGAAPPHPDPTAPRRHLRL